MNIETKIARALVLAALDKGYLVSVSDGEAFPVKLSNNFVKITEAMASTDQDVLIFRTADKQKAGFVQLIYGNDEDLISDCSDNDEMDALCKAAMRGAGIQVF